MEFRQTRLDNGLTIVAELNPAAASLALGFFVATGSRDESPELAGVSHFLEHMVFKGSPSRGPIDVSRHLDRIGADGNASTSEENTVFYASVLPEFQSALVELLADILRPALRPADFDTEKQVILEEIALYEDRPSFRVYEKLMAEHFRGHPLGNSILGSPRSVEAMRRQDMAEYLDRRYGPGNITLVGAGNLDFDGLASQVGQLCGHWAPGAGAADAARRVEPPPGRRARTVLADPKVLREHVGLISAAPPAGEDARYAAQLLACVLGDSTGSRLYFALVEPALADEASVSYNGMTDAGTFLTFLSCDADKTARAIQVVQEEFARFLDRGPDEEELLAAKNKIACGATLKGELPIGRLGDVGFDWIYRRQYLPLKQQIEQLFAVTADDVLALARQWDLAAYSLLTLGPLESL